MPVESLWYCNTFSGAATQSVVLHHILWCCNTVCGDATQYAVLHSMAII